MSFSVSANNNDQSGLNYYNGTFMGLNLNGDGSISIHLSKFGKYINDFTDNSSAHTFAYLARMTGAVLSELNKISYLLETEPGSIDVQEEPKGMMLTYENNGSEHKYFIGSQAMEEVNWDYGSYIKGQIGFFNTMYEMLREIYPVEEEALSHLLILDNSGVNIERDRTFSTILNVQRIQKIKEDYLLPYFDLEGFFPTVINKADKFSHKPCQLMTERDALEAINGSLPNHYKAEDLETALDNLIKYMMTDNAVVDKDKVRLVLFGEPDLAGADSVMDYLIRFKSSDPHMLAVIQLLSWMAYYNDWHKERYICTTIRRGLFYNGIISSVVNAYDRINNLETSVGFVLPNRTMIELGMFKYNRVVKL